MLAEGRDAVHYWLDIFHADRRNQGAQAAYRRINLAPAGCELWMLKKFFHGVEPGIGDPAIFQSLADSFYGETIKCLRNQFFQLVAVLHAPGIGVKSGIDGKP